METKWGSGTSHCSGVEALLHKLYVFKYTFKTHCGPNYVSFILWCDDSWSLVRGFSIRPTRVLLSEVLTLALMPVTLKPGFH